METDPLNQTLNPNPKAPNPKPKPLNPNPKALKPYPRIVAGVDAHLRELGWGRRVLLGKPGPKTRPASCSRHVQSFIGLWVFIGFDGVLVRVLVGYFKRFCCRCFIVSSLDDTFCSKTPPLFYCLLRCPSPALGLGSGSRG